MSKGQRIVVFLTALFFLAIGAIIFKAELSYLEDKAVLIMSALIMLSFTTLLAEHYFTRPTDVIASTISILLLLSPVYGQLQSLGVWFWIFWSYNALILLVALSSLLLLDAQSSENSTQNRISKNLKIVAVRFGNGKFLWFSLFCLFLLFYVDNQSNLFLIVFAYAAALILIEPRKAIFDFSKIKSNNPKEIARIFSVQGGNTYLAKRLPNVGAVARFDIVAFKPNVSDEQFWLTGLVIDTYILNEEHWIRILTDFSLNNLNEGCTYPESFSPGGVYLLSTDKDKHQLNRLVGIVSERSNIEQLRFDYSFQTPIQEGNLLEVSTQKGKVLYQVVEGTTGKEILDSKDEAGTIVGEAVQLGIWSPENRCFSRYGWVPTINSPVYMAENIDPPQPVPTEFQIGNIPDTNFPVFIDRKVAVTHHLAILGVTGSGKSVFSRNLVRKIAEDGTKIICVDFTNEYGKKLNDLIGAPLIADGHADALFKAINAISLELDKFPNQRDHKLIATKESELHHGFTEALTNFVNSENQASLFELPDVANSTGILDYTRWFFKALFDMAKNHELNGRRICVVLEEAHTIVPEWNFLGIEDKRSSAVVNSIAQIALQGRKYGVGFIVIGQRTANISKTVLTQCNSVIAFQQFDKTSADFLGNYMGQDFVSSLTRLQPRHAIAVGKAFSSGTPIIFKVPDIVEPD